MRSCLNAPGEAGGGGRVLTRFPHPEPPRAPKNSRPPVLPVFLPFAGCPARCVFCNQTAQTGQAPRPLDAALRDLDESLSRPGPPVELAFYGGTFTALPDPWPRRFLQCAERHLATGRVARVRCSTRPDAVGPAVLEPLRGLGLSLVELGVQSFDDAALAASRRGYDGAAALRGCEAVLAAGLSLGVQLMPGMPGQRPEVFAGDVARAAALAPELCRLYPCLVLEGTELAALWRAGGHAPWALDRTVDALAEALLVLWRAGIPAARVGLAEEPGLPVLAGPRHPALGQLARSRALVLHVRERLAGLRVPARTLCAPRRLQGEVLGHGNALAAEYAALGLAVRLWDEPDLALLGA